MLPLRQLSFCPSSLSQSFLPSLCLQSEKSVSITEKMVEFLFAAQDLVIKPSNFFEKFVYNIS
jgi:hypothetical protein